MLAPLAAVLLFLAAIVSAFWYLRLEEMDREQEAVRRDVEYAQQRLRLRLLERQEQLMRIARDISNKEVDAEEFVGRAESHGHPVPRAAGADLDRRAPPHQGQLCSAQRAPAARCATPARCCGPAKPKPSTAWRATCSSRCTRSPPPAADGTGLLQLHVPLADQGKFAGVILGEYSIDGLLRYGVPAEVSAKYAVALLDGKGRLLAGSSVPPRNPATQLLPWARAAQRIRGAGLAGGQRPASCGRRPTAPRWA